MASDFGDLVSTIVTALDGIAGLRVDVAGWPDVVSPPAALLTPTDQADAVLDESVTVESFELLVVVQDGGSFRAAQKALHPYTSRTGASSVKAVLRAALGGNLLSCNRQRFGRFEINGTPYPGVQFALEVISQ